MPNIIEIYQILAISSLQAALPNTLHQDTRITTLFKQPIQDKQPYNIHIHEQLFGSRFKLENRKTLEVAFSGSLRYVDEHAKRQRYITAMPPFDAIHVMRHQDLFQRFPHVRAQWIFWATFGLSMLMQSEVPSQKIQNFLEPAQGLTKQAKILTPMRHDIRFPTCLTQKSLEQISLSEPIQMRIAEPNVISNGEGRLIGSFSYELRRAQSTLVTAETSLLLTRV